MPQAQRLAKGSAPKTLVLSITSPYLILMITPRGSARFLGY